MPGKAEGIARRLAGRNKKVAKSFGIDTSVLTQGTGSIDIGKALVGELMKANKKIRRAKAKRKKK